MKPPPVHNAGIVVLCTKSCTNTQGVVDGTVTTRGQNNVTKTIYSWLSLEKNETIYVEPPKGGVSADIDESTRNLVTQALV